MSAEMITAIAAFASGIAAIVSAFLLNRKTVALLEYRMGKVERQLESHNRYAEKFAETANKIAAIQTDVAVIKTKLEYIEEEK